MAEAGSGQGGAPGLSADWRRQLLDELNAPTNNLTLTALALWAQSEGVASSAHNWLATTMSAPGATAYNGVGVRNYPSVRVGVLATAATIRQHAYGMPAILKQLRAGDDALKLWAAINASGWCAHCQGGQYPIAMYHWAHGHPAVTGSTSPPPAPHAKQVKTRGWDSGPVWRSAGGRTMDRGDQVSGHLRRLGQILGKHSKIR